MREIRHILVPVDFSDPSREALHWAAELGRRFGAKLLILHVYPVPGYVLPDGFVTAGPEVLTEVESRTRATLEQWAQDARDAGAGDVAISTAIGNATPEILRTCDDLPADLVVMGAHGRTGLARMLLGSVAEKVVRHAQVPVMTVPAPEPETPAT